MNIKIAQIKCRIGNSRSVVKGEQNLEWHYVITLHFTMRILKKCNSNTKSLAYMSLVRPILEYGAACWDPYREEQISALDRVQKKAAKFAHH